jgi:predicted ester cyclase
MEAGKSAIREFFAAIDKAQSMSPLDALAAPSYVAHFPGAPPMDRDGTKAYGDVFFAACPGLRHSVDDIIAEGNNVAARLTIRGAHTRPFVTPAGPIPPVGRSFELHVMNWYRFEHGKLVEQRVAFDMLGFLQQIGAMPGPGGST